MNKKTNDKKALADYVIYCGALERMNDTQKKYIDTLERRFQETGEKMKAAAETMTAQTKVIAALNKALLETRARAASFEKESAHLRAELRAHIHGDDGGQLDTSGMTDADRVETIRDLAHDARPARPDPGQLDGGIDRKQRPLFIKTDAGTLYLND